MDLENELIVADDLSSIKEDFVAFSEAKFIIYVYSTVKVGYV